MPNLLTEIETAVRILRTGGLVAFPTETVYGLGADAGNEQAIRKIFQAKERPFDHPLIVHLASINKLSDWAREIPESAFILARAFWPGPLTIIFKKQPHVLDLVTGGQDTVGVRIPRHSIAQALLQNFDNGIAAPSANKFTHISPTTADAVREELGSQVDLILDGGACEVGLESTIIDMSRAQPTILRPGMIHHAAIANALGTEVLLQRSDGVTIRTPGMHHLHYAPATKTVLVETMEISNMLESMDLPVAVLMHTQINLTRKQVDFIQMPRDAAAYAHDLYVVLRKLDQKGYKRIIIERVPDGVEWEGIRDRLGKASGER